MSLKPTELSVWRAQLDSSRSGTALLKVMLAPHDVAALIPQLPTEDLYRCLHLVGLEDSTELLALASSEQVRGMLDMDIWSRDELSLERLDPWLQALMYASPEHLMKHVLELDDALINWLLRSSVYAQAVEDPDSFDPPDLEHVVTPDNRLCVIFPHPAPRDLPIKIFLDALMRENPAFCINLLLGASAALPSNLQERAYRWRSGRMADQGFVEYYEALEIYSPPRSDLIPLKGSGDGERAAHHWMTRLVEPEERLSRALSCLSDEERETLLLGLGYSANMILSADRVELWDEEAGEESLNRLRAGLALGLEFLGEGSSPQQDAVRLQAQGVNLIFRTGYAQMKSAALPLRGLRLALGEDPIGLIDLEPLRPWAEVLRRRHPCKPNGAPLSSLAEVAEAQSQAKLIAALYRAAPDRPAQQPLGAWLFTGLLRDSQGLEGFGRLPLALLERSHRALFERGRLGAQARCFAEDWWDRIGGENSEALNLLLEVAIDQLAALSPQELEPRFLPLILLES